MSKLILLVCFFYPFCGLSQSYKFTKTAGGPSYDFLGDGCIDLYGNTYFIGQYSDSINFKQDYDGDDKRKALGNSDIFIMKINADKSYAWTKTIYQSNLNYAIDCDLQGNIYVVATFGGLKNFGYEYGIIDERISKGQSDIYILKINVDGSYGGVKTIGGDYYEYIKDIEIDEFGNIFLAGSYSSMAINFGEDFGVSDIKTNTSTSNRKCFLTKINADYSYGWTKVFDTYNYAAIQSVSSDEFGNVFVTGVFEGQADFKKYFGGTDLKSAFGKRDAFITKINHDDSYAWTYTFGGKYDDEGTCLANDSDGNVYLAGLFREYVNFKRDFGGDDLKYSGSMDSFLFASLYIVKIDKDGSYVYSRTMESDNAYAGAGKLIVDNCGNPILYGSVLGYGPNSDCHIDFGKDFGKSDFREGLSCSFYMRFNTDGSYGYTKILQGQNSASQCALLDKSNNLILGGSFNGPSDFGADFGITDKKAPRFRYNDYDIFFTVINLNDQYFIDSNLVSDRLTICGEIDTVLTSKGNWQSYLWTTGSTNSELSIQKEGIYSLQVRTGTCIINDTIEVISNPVPDYLLNSHSSYFQSESMVLNDKAVIYLKPTSNNPMPVTIEIDEVNGNSNKYYWYLNEELVSQDHFWKHDFFIEGKYSVISKVENHYGCSTTKEISFIIQPILFVPNLLTPNGDLVNEQFEIYYNGNTDYQLSVYNRWGGDYLTRVIDFNIGILLMS